MNYIAGGESDAADIGAPSLLEHLADAGRWAYDPATDTITLSPDARRLPGVPDDDAVPRGAFLERVRPDEREAVETMLTDPDATERTDHWLRTDDGWVRLRTIAHSDPEADRVVGVIQELESHQSVDERELFFEGPVVVFKWRNAEGWPVEYVSPNVADILGYEPDVFEDDLAYSEIVHDDDLERVNEEVAANSTDGTERFHHEPYRIVTDCGDVRWVLDYTKIVRAGSEITHYLGYLVDVTERKERQLRLEQAESIGDFGSWTWSALEDGYRWSDGVYEIFERPRDAEPLSTEAFLETVHPADRDDVRAARRAASEGSLYDVTYRIVVDGWTKWFWDRAEFSFDADGNPVSATGVLRDITERKRRERELETLNETAQDLLQLESVDAIADAVVDVAAEIFDAVVAGINLYDDAEEALLPAAYAAPDGTNCETPPAFSPGDNPAWEAFVSRTRTSFERADVPASMADETAIYRGEVFPLGDHGVFVLGETTARSFDEQTIEAANVLAATTEAALDRAVKTRSLRERTAEATAKDEELEYVTELNETIRSLHTAVVEAESRAEIHRSVCRVLTTIDGFDGAWIGEPDTKRNDVVPAAEATVPDDYLEDQQFSLDAETPAPPARVARDRTVVDVDRIPQDVQREDWRNTALIHGYRSVVSVPIQYEGLFYGTLTVYSTQTESFDDRTKDVLEEFGTLIGYARNAVEQRNALFGSEMVDLTFEIDLESDDVVRSIASELGTTVEVQNVNRRNRNSYLVHCAIPDADPGDVTELSDRVVGLDAAQPLSESSSSTFELIVVNECIATETIDLGAVLRSIRVSERACDVVFSVPRHRDHRRFAQQVRDRFSGASLTAKRQSSPAESISWSNLFDAVLAEKQAEVLTAAYHSGYFDKTRKQTGAEIADALGIAQPTFSKRLRAAQHDLLASVIDGDRPAGE